MSRKIKNTLIALVVIVLIAILYIAFWWPGASQASFPQIDGQIDLPALDAPVDVYRDPQGIPHIFASTEHDLFFAQGFVHAQDRFWQMDMNRHASAGRLSELLGSAGLETDRFLRTLGWERVAREELAMMDDENVTILEHYAAGVNAYLAGRSNAELSAEYLILPLLNRGYAPNPWEPLNSLTWAKAMAWDLGKSKLNIEIDRSLMLAELTPEQVAELFPPYPADKPVIVNDQSPFTPSEVSSVPAPDYAPAVLAALQQLSARLDSLQPFLDLAGGEFLGSNSWAVSGDLSASGSPMLANDPHLDVGIPHIWYQVGLHCRPVGPDCPDDMIGFSFPGVPGIIIGHNARIAWGFSNVGPDVLDLYIEKINPDNPDQYEVNGEWVDMQVLTETIIIGASKTEELTVRITRHGPIISEVHGTLAEEDFAERVGIDLPEHYAIAISWTALQPGLTLQAVTLEMTRAQNWDEFRQAASNFAVPSQNLLYADVDGNIGYQMPGRIPIRAGGADGRYPAAGWNDDSEWAGFIPFDQLPYSFNPPEGFIVTANNAVVDDTYPYFLNDVWANGYRAQRILDLIQAAPGPIDSAYFKTIQTDNFNSNAAVLLPVFMQVSLTDDSLEEYRSLFDGWDYQMDLDSPAAALFASFWKQLLAAAFHDEIPEDFWPDGNTRWITIVHSILDHPSDPWWDDVTTPETEQRDDIMRAAFSAAVADLEDRLGSDASAWTWGDLHLVYYKHQVMGNFPVISSAFDRGPFRVAGGTSIVNASGWSASEPDFRIAGSSASFRMIADLADWSNSLIVMPVGQSGHAGHLHYVDLTDLWRLFEYYPMYWELEPIQAAAEGHLRLVP
jgi:penicillin amidase